MLSAVETNEKVKKLRRGTGQKSLPLTRKNGQFPVAMIAGGPADFARELRDRLGEKVGVLAKYHLDWEKSQTWLRPIPADVDMVIFLQDMAGHQNFYTIRESAKKAGVRFICTSRKWSHMYQCLFRAGIKVKEANLPETILANAIMEEPPKPEGMVELPNVDVTPAGKASALLQMEVVAPPVQVTTPPPINVTVSPTSSPAAHELRKGSPRAETAVLIAMLYRHAIEDGIQILITPTSFSVEPAPASH